MKRPKKLDHIWVAVSPWAPERAALVRAGFRIAPGVNRHDGQGTASITVELADHFFELIWVDDSVPVTPGLEAVPRKFGRRAAWRSSGWCPFGIGLRRTASAPDSLPFATWEARAAWMQPGQSLAMLAARTDTVRPRVWVVPRRMSVVEDSSLPPSEHPARRSWPTRTASGGSPAPAWRAPLAPCPAPPSCSTAWASWRWIRELCGCSPSPSPKGAGIKPAISVPPSP